MQAGSASPDISTPSNSSVKQTIRLLYGNTIARDLISTTIAPESEAEVSNDEDALMETGEAIGEKHEGPWKAEAHFTNVNYHAKKTVFLLFINRK